MTLYDATALISFIDHSKVRQSDRIFLSGMEQKLKQGISPSVKQSKWLQDIYRYTVGGGKYIERERTKCQR